MKEIEKDRGKMEIYPLIGVLVPSRHRRKRIIKLYKSYHNLPLKLFAFTRADILWEKQQIAGISLIGGETKEIMFPFPQAVYNRCYNKKTTTFRRLEDGICFLGGLK